MASLTSYQSDIRQLFPERDIRAMSKAFNSASYDGVKAHAAFIYDRHEERAFGPRIALNCLTCGWLTVTNLE
jgi:hypothetical protein